MSTTEIPMRPSRRTPHLDLPVPGDAYAADFVTDIGKLADALDALAALGRFGYDPGDIKTSARQTPPDGWLLCDGRAVSRAIFADLFAAIGVVYGAGDGSTTFNIPDLRDTFAMGASGTVGRGARGGATSVSLSTAQIPAHSHGGATGTESADHAHYVSGGTSEDWPDHAHYQWADMNNSAQVRLWDGGAYYWVRGSGWTPTGGATARHAHSFAAWTGGRNAAHTHGIAVEGGNGAHENRPPFVALNFFIKT